MKIEELININTQRQIIVRLGTLSEEGEERWEEEWRRVRILISHGLSGDWYMTPLTKEGRPLGLIFEGHTRQGQAFMEQGGPRIIQVLNLLEPVLLKEGVETGELETVLREYEMGREDLSEIGKAIYDAVTTHKDLVNKTFVSHMLELASK